MRQRRSTSESRNPGRSGAFCDAPERIRTCDLRFRRPAVIGGASGRTKPSQPGEPAQFIGHYRPSSAQIEGNPGESAAIRARLSSGAPRPSLLSRAETGRSRRLALPALQAGGHWFEPSTAHCVLEVVTILNGAHDGLVNFGRRWARSVIYVAEVVAGEPFQPAAAIPYVSRRRRRHQKSATDATSATNTSAPTRWTPSATSSADS